MPSNILFTHRIRSRAEIRARLPLAPVSAETATEHLQSKGDIRKERLIYIHIPFCTNTCDFCGYNRLISDLDTQELYIQKLEAQIKYLGETEWAKAAPFSVVHIGGGSPSCLDENQTIRILDTIKQCLPLTHSFECTMEFTLNDVKIDKLKVLLKNGFNRISLGVQSFDTNLRQKLGRKLEQQQVVENIKKVHESGFRNIYIDLIYGIAGQNNNLWQQDLEQVEKMPITGCSVYALVNFPNSKMAASGQFQQISIEEEYEFFKAANEKLTNLPGWTCYTPVQYGHNELGKSEYIQKLANGADILALGCGSGGKMGNLQYLVERDIKTFLTSEDQDLFSTARCFTLSEAFITYQKVSQLAESMFIGKDVLNKLPPELINAIEQLQNKKLVVASGNGIKLTQMGRFWAGNISEFLARAILSMVKKD